jgi:hypothetical protein
MSADVWRGRGGNFGGVAFIGVDRSELRQSLLGPTRGCTGFEIQIAQLQGHLRVLERDFSEPDLGVSERQRLLGLICETQTTINSVNDELTDCGSDLTIVGVERTQGIQYFSFNGQGSGYATDNNVPLIAQRIVERYAHHHDDDGDGTGGVASTSMSIHIGSSARPLLDCRGSRKGGKQCR